MSSIATHTLPHPEIIIFDVDGTLIDVSRSYREAAPVAASIYLRLLGLVAPPLPRQPWMDQDALIAALQAAARPLAGLTPLLPEWEPLVTAVRAAGGGLAGLSQIISDRNAHLVWRTGDAATTDLVQRIFSETYLGADLIVEHPDQLFGIWMSDA